MKKQLYKIIVAVLSLNLLFQVSSWAQSVQNTVVVNDESGNPIRGAIVTVGEGSDAILTNEKGEFMLQVKAKTPVLIEADGFESKLVYAFPPPLGLATVVLIKMPYQMGENDVVSLPFGTLKKRQITGAVSVLNPEQIIKYDQQNSFTGALNGRVPGLFGSSSIRGMENALVVVDGIPREAGDLNLEQIQQITVLKDLSTGMLYGSQANQGIMLITTKRGELLKKTMRINAEYGYNRPVSYPKYLSAPDYMTLFNEALSNDGLTPKYSATEIQNTLNRTDPVRYPDENYYNSTYLKDWSSFYNLVGEASGGNEVAKYYLNLGWNHNNSLLKLGEGGKEKNDRLNLRGNVNYRLTDNINIKFDGSVVITFQNGPRYLSSDFWALSSVLKPDYSPVLIPSELMKDQSLLGAAKLIDDKYLLGGTSEYPYNIYGEMTKSGSRNVMNRLFQMNTGLDFDFNFITQGLTGGAYLAFDMYNQFSTVLQNTYAVYRPVYAGDTINSIIKYGQDVKQTDKVVNDVSFYRRVGIYGTLNYNRIFNNIHEINAVALGYRDTYNTEDVLEPAKHLHFGLRINYSYRNKYIAELTGVLAGSGKLFESNRYAFSPGVGLGWILSEENFLKSNSLINYLKIRANWATNYTDEGINYFLYKSSWYSQGSVFNYAQGTYNNYARSANTGNTSLTWEKQMELNFGFESLLLNNKLGVEGSYFYRKESDLLSQRLNYYPVYFSGDPYENYGSNQTQGLEFGLNFTTNLGKFKVKLGSNLVYSVPKALKVDELNYKETEAYLKHQGKPTDAMFGYVALGLFTDQNDINTNPVQTFGLVRPGDIKYMDLNSDGVIDDRDQMMIGNSKSRIGYGINLSIKYKAFELFVLATGQDGGNVYYKNDYYWVSGNLKYSAVVLDRWTPETAATASYPRLSSTTNSNNFRNSTFWLDDNNWFTLHTTQLTYTLPVSIGALKEIRFFLRGYNLATFSKIKDKLDLNIGSAPKTRDFSFGLTATF
jgi:TonB-linked SusC/RagA family outer membrane protein